MASAAVAVQESKLIAEGWIINRKDDLIWFVGSVFASYGLLCANLMLGISAAVLTWIWALGVDGPHVYGTVSRTYADREERRKRAKLCMARSAVPGRSSDGVGGAVRLLGTDVGDQSLLLRFTVGLLPSGQAAPG
jgi:hypothetical protein